MRINLSKLADGFVAFNQRQSRGNGLKNVVQQRVERWAMVSVYAAALDRIFEALFNFSFIEKWPEHVITIAVTGFFLDLVTDYFVGLWDEKKGKIWAREAQYVSRRIDPFSREMLGRMKALGRVHNTDTYDDDWNHMENNLKKKLDGETGDSAATS